MRAAVLVKPGEAPVIDDFDEPARLDGAVVIDVRTAALGGWDVQGAYSMGIEYPRVVRGEGVGHTQDGSRVYFGERSVPPFGAWAERTVVPAYETWHVPDDIDDELAIALGVAGAGALVPLTEANLKPADSVLIVGATGTVGQIALQLARYFGAGWVVAAARDREALDRIAERRLADDIAYLGEGDDAGALTATGVDGFDVVLDVVFGDPSVAALKTTRVGARVMTIDAQADMMATTALTDPLFHTRTCVGIGQRTAAERHRLWRQMLDIAREIEFTLDYAIFTFEEAPQAWAAQQRSPHAKVIGAI